MTRLQISKLRRPPDTLKPKYTKQTKFTAISSINDADMYGVFGVNVYDSVSSVATMCAFQSLSLSEILWKKGIFSVWTATFQLESKELFLYVCWSVPSSEQYIYTHSCVWVEKQLLFYLTLAVLLPFRFFFACYLLHWK